MPKTTYGFFLNIGSLFGFVPWTNLSKSELVNTKCAKIYPSCISLAIVLTYLLSREKLIEIDEIPISLTILTIFYLGMHSVYARRNSWKSWIKLYYKTNEDMKLKLKETMEPGWKSVIIFAAYIALLTFNRMISYILLSKNAVKITDLLLYELLVFKYFFILFALILKKGFKLLNKSSQDLNYENGLTLSIIANLNKEKTMYCMNLYKNLYKMVVCFNDLFGWAYIFSLLIFFMTMLIFVQSAISCILNGKMDFQLGVFYCLILSYRLVSKPFFHNCYETRVKRVSN